MVLSIENAVCKDSLQLDFYTDEIDVCKDSYRRQSGSDLRSL